MNEESVPFFHYWHTQSEKPTTNCYAVLFDEETRKTFFGKYNQSTQSWIILYNQSSVCEEYQTSSQSKVTHWMELDLIPKPVSSTLETRHNFLQEVVAAILESC